MPTIKEAIATAVEHQNNGRLADAEAIYRQVLEIIPEEPDCLHLLGLIAHQVGKNDEALKLISRAIQAADDRAAYHHHKGVVLQALGRRDDARNAFQIAVGIAPADADCWNNYGNLLQEMRRIDEALDCHRRAAELAPGNFLVHFNLGIVLEKFGRVDEALESYHVSVNLLPNFPAGWNSIGEVHRKAGRINEAIEAYQKTLAIKPDYPEALNNLGIAYKSKWMLPEAQAILRRCLGFRPEYPAALSNLAGVLQLQGRLDEAIEMDRRAIALDPSLAIAHSNIIFVRSYHPRATGSELREEGQKWETRQLRGMPSFNSRHGNIPDPERPLKIGFVSPDFRDHAVSYFFLPLFRAFDRAKVRVYGYNETLRDDTVTDWLRAAADEWRDTRMLHDEGLERLVRQDEIDILVDCSGHSGGNRLPFFLRRSAPIQVSTLLGHGGTTGLSAMDYFLGDPHITPDGHEKYFSERLVRLPRFFAPFLPRDHWPPVVGDVPDGLTFCCVGDPVRVGQGTVDLWRRVLDAVPGSTLLYKGRMFGNPTLVRHWKEKFAPLGERLVLEGLSGTWANSMDVYGRVRVVLDTFPAAGATSSLIPLWMGVPVVSRAGIHSVQRFGVSVLVNAGLSDFVAESDDDYVRIASELIVNERKLRDFRRGLRTQIAASPVCDASGIAREHEAIFREMWLTWCRERAN